MEAMRIRPQPVCRRLLLPFLMLDGIGDALAAAAVVPRRNIVDRERLVALEAVPPPLRLGAEGNAVFVGFRKCLQPADVNGEREFSIAHRERAKGVDFRKRHVVPDDNGASIDAPAVVAGLRARRTGEDQAERDEVRISELSQ